MTSVQKQNVGAIDGKTSMNATMTLHDTSSNSNKRAAVLMALSNKNTVTSGSQVVVTNSQLAMAQNDRFRISGGIMSISGAAAAKEDSDDNSRE
ncbi:Interferon-induced gtp-binding protein mx [Globisporangium polare]